MDRGSSEVLWRDVSALRIIMIIIVLGFTSLVSYDFVHNLMTNAEFDYFLYVLMLLFCLYGLIHYILPRSTYITNDGIRIGNMPNGMFEYNLFTYKKKAAFIRWNELGSIDIIRRVERGSSISYLRSYLVIRLKSNKTFETYIAQPEPFYNKLKSIHKDSLIKEKSLRAFDEKGKLLSKKELEPDPEDEQMCPKDLKIFTSLAAIMMLVYVLSETYDMWNEGLFSPIYLGAGIGIVLLVIIGGILLSEKRVLKLKNKDNYYGYFIMAVLGLGLLVLCLKFIIIKIFY